ncbi:MAG: site-2 protease family protein [Actinomycetota bacterium]
MSEQSPESQQPRGSARTTRGSKQKDGVFASSSFTIARVRGITIGAHWSWLIVAVLVSWSLSSFFFPSEYPGLGDRTYLTMGVVSALIFFASILLHELGHAFRALKEGMKVGDITLWLFGGVARFEGMFPSPGAEFRIAIAGPLVSLVLAIAFTVAGGAAEAAGVALPVVAVADYLGMINFLVLAFNLVPALPLDGGRVLRSWLWHRQRNFTAATLSAAKAGKAFAYVLVGMGFLGFFSEAFAGGIWFVLLGFFILQAAEAEGQYALVTATFRNLRVRDLMTPNPVTVAPQDPVSRLLDSMVGPRGHSTYPVADGDGRLAGLISVRMAADVAADRRDVTPVRDVMIPGIEVPTLEEGTSMIDGLGSLRTGPRRAVVLSPEGSIAGIVSISDVAKAVELEQVKGTVDEPGARSSGGLVWVVVTLLIALAASAFYYPPLAVTKPGPSIDVAEAISIEGVPTTEINGRYLLLSVAVTQPSALGALWAAVHPDQSVTPVSALVPEGISDEEFVQAQLRLFEESQLLAAAAAAEAAGLSVQLRGEGARLVATVPDSPAEGKLQEDDLITAVNGTEVNLSADLRDIISVRPAGTTFEIELVRDGRTRTVEVASARIDAVEELSAGIGVLVATENFDMDLPFEIDFAQMDVGGPSAGLAYALAIMDMLDERDLAGGETVAATGSISIEGAVRPVGGIAAKGQAAKGAGAEILLLHTDDVDKLRDADDLTVRGVTDLDEAVEALVQLTGSD